MQTVNQSTITTKTWNNIKDSMKSISSYSLDETVLRLKKDDMYTTLKGKAKNRTLMKNDLKLYKSIMEHTNILEKAFKDQNTYKTSYNFSHRISFIIEKDLDLERLRCKCGKKYSWTAYCRHCPDYKQNQLGKPHTNETKKKMRLAALSYISQLKGQAIPRYNKDSISLIEDYGKENGYIFMHAENGGEYFVKELGYFLDGYDPINNIAIEVDEKRHFTRDGNLLDKDIERQEQIENLLGCKFIRIKI
jgi:hypothetical protein